MTPPRVWREFSYRQMLGLYEIYAEKKHEEVLFTKALHGALTEDEIKKLQRQGSSSRDGWIPVSEMMETGSIDVNKVSPEEWSSFASHMNERNRETEGGSTIDLNKCKTPEEYRECGRKIKESKKMINLRDIKSEEEWQAKASLVNLGLLGM